MIPETSIDIREDPEPNKANQYYTQNVYLSYFYYVYYVVQYYVLGEESDGTLGYVEKRTRSKRGKKGLIGLLAGGFCCCVMVALLIAGIVVLALIPVYLDGQNEKEVTALKKSKAFKLICMFIYVV